VALSSGSDIVRSMVQLERTMSPQAIEKRLTGVGVQLKTVGLRGAATTKVGADLMMTRGWSQPGPLRLSFKVDGESLLMHRSGRSAGPWRVAEEGRNQGNAAGFSGPGINVKTGKTTRNTNGSMRKVRARKAKRFNGTTQGFGTWTATAAAFDQQAAKLVTKGNREAVIKAFLSR
jgi:hypothetical protein